MRIIKSLKELLFLVVIFLCASNSSLKEHTASKAKELSSEESSASNSSEEKQTPRTTKTIYPPYESAIRGECFLDDKDSAIKRLDNNLKYFSEIVQTAKFQKVLENTKIAEAIGELVSTSKYNPKALNTNVLLSKIGTYASNLAASAAASAKTRSNAEFASEVLKIQESLVNNFLRSVENSIDDKIFNSFSKNAYLKFLRYTIQNEYFKNSQSDCFGLDDLSFIDPIQLFDNYSMLSTQNISMFHPEDCKDKITKNISSTKVSGSDFENDGVAFAFFHQQKLPELKTINSKTIFETFISNTRQFSYSVYQKSNIIKNEIRISNQKINIKGVELAGDEYDILNCASSIFTFVSLQKDGTSYKLIISLRFPVLNKSFIYAFRLRPEFVENITFNFNAPQVYRFDDFKYELENELKVLSYVLNKESFGDQLKKDFEECKAENCKYAEKGFCLNCFDYEGITETFILHEGKCLTECPTGFFGDKIKKICVKCDKTCNTCDDETKCKECNIDYPLRQDDKCVRQCDAGYYEDKKNLKCVKCPGNCEECTGNDVCIRCRAPLALDEDNGKCVTCKDGGLYLTTEKNVLKCKPCMANCISCKSFDTCDECKDKFALKENTQCVECCGKGFFMDKKRCSTCHFNCSECTSLNQCTKCKNAAIKPVNGVCQSELKCDDGYSLFENACHRCPHPNCLKCVFSPIKKCILCEKGYFEKDGNCVSTCGVGFEEIVDKQNNNVRKCQKCPENCDVCNNGVCIKCSKDKGLLNDVCITCPSGFVLCGNECMKCSNEDCDKCNCNNLKECNTCKTKNYLLQGTCVGSCPEKYFSSFTIDEDSGVRKLICKGCPEKCKKCSSETDCIECENVFEQNVCKDKCSEGFKLIEVYSEKLNTKVKICKECSVNNCGLCEKKQENCDICKTPFKLYANKCHRECPSGTFVAEKETCSDCIRDCLICNDSKSCLQCKELIQEGVCVNQCDKGYYKKDNKCLPCSDCNECLDNTGDCVNCKGDLFLENKKCIPKCSGGFFQVPNQKICQTCKPPCKECKDREDFCLSCVNASMILSKENKCEDNCKDGQVEAKSSIGKRVCLDCSDKNNCIKCDLKNLDNCLTCKNFIQNGKCVEKCEDGFYSVITETEKKCLPCLSNCKKCSDDKTCAKCFNDLLIKDGSTCVKDCGVNYVQDKQSCVPCLNNECDKCDLSNLKCCTQCSNFLYNCNCYQNCPAGTYADKVTLFNGLTQRVCKDCQIGACEQCNKDSGNTCNKCLLGYFLYKNKCEKECPPGTVNSLTGNECVECGVNNCDKCLSERSQESCDKCRNGFYKKVIGGKIECVQNCGPYYFKSISSLNELVCVRCGDNCIECEDENYCKLCESGLYSRKGKCEKCGDGHYIQAPYCNDCQSGCKSCVNKEVCIECFDGKFLFEGKCNNDCEAKHVKSDKKCEKCPPGCDICDSPDRCVECTSPKILNEGKCIDKCDSGSIEVKIINPKNPDSPKTKTKCIKCLTNDSCEKCLENDLAKCEKCKKDKVLQNDQCLDKCDEGYFENENKGCEKCVNNCKACVNKEKCLKCREKFFLNDKNQCVENCGEGFYPNNDGECISCSKNCKICNAKECIECFGDMKIQDNYCVKECSETYFLEGKVKCEKCPQDCVKCTDKKNCEKCVSPKYPLNGICEDCLNCTKDQEKCVPKVIHKATQKCLLCSQNCLTCDENDTNRCITCAKNKVLTTRNTCEEECTQGTFFKVEADKCKVCLNDCLKCENEAFCQICKPGLYLQPNKESCETTCPIKFRKTEKGECESCTDTKCNYCDSDKNTCKLCEPNMFLLNGKCEKDCPADFYPDLEKNCLKCDSTCAECITEKQCTRCFNENDSLLNYECKDKCPEGSVSVYVTEENPKDKSTKKVKKCKNCSDEKCAKCDATNLSNCLECKGKDLLIETENGISKCVDKCPAKYFEVKLTKRCEKCSENCTDCKNENTCKKCEKGLLENGVCIKSCSKGYYQTGEECLKCEAENCSICSAKEPSKCIVCNDKFVLKNGECATKCGDNYFTVNTQDLGDFCKPCIPNCKTCVNEIECKECILPKYVSGLQGVCVDCKENSGSVIIEKKCYSCTINNCAKCPADVTRLGECEKCLPNFYMTPGGKCEVECPLGYYKNKENGLCVKCLEDKCSQCNPENNCEACKDNLLLQNGKCKVECDLGFYKDENNVCRPCGDKNCGVCDKKHNDKCIKCVDPFALKFEFAVENVKYGKCLENCDKGYFKDSNNNCEKCSEGCLECTTFDTCLKCDISNKYLLKEGKCQTQCGINYTEIDQKCIRCSDPKCNYCAIGDKDKCIDCLPYPRRNYNCVTSCEDKTYLNKQTLICEDCSENCVNCIDKNTCTKCENGFVLEENRCLKKCSQGYTLNVNTKICEKCLDSNCLNCSQRLDDCDLCSKGTFLYKGKCEIDCPSNYFKKEIKDGVVCEKCPCKACENENKCTKCDDGKVLHNGKCLETCPDLFYGKVNQLTLIKECVPCQNSSCLKCSEINPEICTACPENRRNYFNKKGNRLECLESCSDGTFEVSVHIPSNQLLISSCVDCVSPCIQCNSSTQCTKCLKEFSLHNGKCESDCPSGFTKNQEGNCVACGDENCAKCPADNLNKCLECRNGYLFKPSNSCKPECPENYREAVDETGRKICNACPVNCKKCDEKECKECAKDFFFLYDSNECGICNSFDIITNKNRCTKCQVENCVICEDTKPDQCKQCKPKYVNINGECKENCPEGFYKDEKVTCQPCKSECKTCKEKDTCIDCKGDQSILTDEGKCTDQCPPKFVPVEGRCKQCETIYCKVCEKKILKNCKECLEDYFLYNTKCVKECQNGTRSSVINVDGNNVKVCYDCPVGCSECNERQCIKCNFDAGFYMQNGVCVKDCHVGHYLEVTEKDQVKTGVCVKCQGENCNTCNKEGCVKCTHDSYEFILNGKLTCIQSCPVRTFLDKEEKKCIDCSANCKNCISKSVCERCEDNFILYGEGNCVKECPHGFTKVVSENKGNIPICTKCNDRNCKKCQINDPTKCVECYPTDKNDNPLILVDSNKTCEIKKECVKGKFLDNETGKCEECPADCDECVSRQECTKCKNDKIPINGACYITCPPRRVEISNRCIPCEDSKCLKCATDLKTCFKCEVSSYFYQNACHATCPQGSYPSLTSKECITCPYNCKTCNNNDECTSCIDGFFLLKGHCVNPCPEKYFGSCNNNSCDKCHQSCETCKGNKESDCIGCAEGYYKLGDLCVRKDSCPKGTYPLDLPTRICKECDKFCRECSGPDQCICINKFKWDPISKKCVYAYGVYNLYQDSLFDFYTFEKKKFKYSMQRDANGIAVSYSQVSFTFWMRLVKQIFYSGTPFLNVFTFNSQSKIEFGINQNGDCELFYSGRSGKDRSEIVSIKEGCTYEKLYYYKHFGVVLSLEDQTFNLGLYYEIDGNKFESSFVKFKTPQEDLVTVDSEILFNPIPYNSVFQVASFAIREYNPFTLSTYDDFINKKPFECDYNCKICKNSQCAVCVEGEIFDSEGKGVIVPNCPAAYVHPHPSADLITGQVTRDIRDVLDIKLIERPNYVSSIYSFGGWFYVSGLQNAEKKFTSFNYLTTIYENAKNNFLKDIFNIEFIEKNKVSVNGEVTEIVPLKEKNFYYIMVGVRPENVTVWTSTKNDTYELVTVINKKGVAGRLFQDLTFNIAQGNIIKSLYETRFYFNNIPEEKFVIRHINTLNLDEKCEEYDELKNCIKCKSDLVLRNGICEPQSIVHVLSDSIINLIEKETKEFDVEQFINEDYDKKFTFSFFIRRKNLPLRDTELENVVDNKEDGREQLPVSNNIQPFNVFSLFDRNEKFTNLIAIRNHNNDSNMDILFRISEKEYFRVVYAESEIDGFSFIKFIVSVDQTTKEVNYFIGDKTKNIKMRKISGSVSNIINPISFNKFGDKYANEMNVEVVWPKFQSDFYSNEVDELIKNYKDPNLCGFGCVKCDFNNPAPNNKCLSCYNNQEVSKVTGQCPNILSGFKYIKQYESMYGVSQNKFENSTELSLDDHLRLTKLDSVTDLGFFNRTLNLESSSNSYSVAGTILFYEDDFVDTTTEFNVFALNNFREKTKYKLKSDLNVNGVNFLRLDIIKTSNKTVKAIIRLKHDFANSVVTIDENINLEINKWISFYIKISKKTLFIVFEYADKNRNYQKVFEKTVQLKYEPVSATEMTSIVKNFGRVKTKINMAALFIYLIPNDNQENFYETIKSKNSITRDYQFFDYQPCDSKCKVCSQLFDDSKNPNSCLECHSVIDDEPVFNDEGKCIIRNGTYAYSYLLLLESYLTELLEYHIPNDNYFANLNDNYDITFYFRRNYLPQNFQKRAVFFEIGEISISIISSIDSDSLVLTVPNDVQEEKILDIPIDLSDSWFQVNLKLNSTVVSTTINKFVGVGIENAPTSSNSYKIKNYKVKKLLGSKIRLSNLNNRISIHTLRLDSEKIPPKLNILPVSDRYANVFHEMVEMVVSKNQIIPDDFFLINNRRQKNFVEKLLDKPRINLDSQNMPYHIAFSDLINPSDKLFINEQFQISFDIKITDQDAKLLKSNRAINILKINNNLRSAISLEEQEQPATNIISLIMNSPTVFTLQIGNRLDFVRNGNKPSEIVLKLPNDKLVNNFYKIFIVKTRLTSSRAIRIMIFNDRATSNFVYVDFDITSNHLAYDRLTNRASIYFFDNEKTVNEGLTAEIRDLIIKPKFDNILDEKARMATNLSMKTQRNQDICEIGDEVCTKCRVGVLNDGLCLPNQNSVLLISNKEPIFLKISESSKHSILRNITLDSSIAKTPITKYSFSFNFKKFFFDGTKFTPMINIFNDNKVIFSLTMDHQSLRFTNHLAKEYYEQNQGVLMLPEYINPYLHPLREFFVVVNVDLNKKRDELKLFMYPYDQKYQNTQFNQTIAIADYKAAKNSLTSFVPVNLQFNLGSDVGSEVANKKNIDSYFHSLIFNPNFFIPSNTEQRYRVRFSGICDVPCKVLCGKTNGICPADKLIEKNYDLSIDKYARALNLISSEKQSTNLLSSVPLIRRLRDSDPQLRSPTYYNEFLIKFDLSLNDFGQTNQKNYVNKNILFVITNDKVTTWKLTMTDKLPEDFVNRALLSVEYKFCEEKINSCENKLIFRTGYFNEQNPTKEYSIILSERKVISKLSVVIYIRNEIRNGVMINTSEVKHALDPEFSILIRENNKITHHKPEINKFILASLLSTDSGIHNHPSLRNFSIDMVSPNINNELYGMLKENTIANESENLCSQSENPNPDFYCQTCLRDTCLRCSEKAFLNEKGICMKRINDRNNK